MFRMLSIIFSKDPNRIVRPWGILGPRYQLTPIGMFYFKIACIVPFTLIPLSFVITENNFHYRAQYVYAFIFILLSTYVFVQLAVRNGKRLS